MVDIAELHAYLFDTCQVRPVAGQEPSIRLTDANDPFRAARKIAYRWRVDHVVRTSIRRSNGQNMLIAPDQIQVGDFVEVTAAARIELVRTRKRRGTVIEFEMYEVAKLFSDEQVQVSAVCSPKNCQLRSELAPGRVQEAEPRPCSGHQGRSSTGVDAWSFARRYQRRYRHGSGGW